MGVLGAQGFLEFSCGSPKFLQGALIYIFLQLTVHLVFIDIKCLMDNGANPKVLAFFEVQYISLLALLGFFSL